MGMEEEEGMNRIVNHSVVHLPFHYTPTKFQSFLDLRLTIVTEEEEEKNKTTTNGEGNVTPNTPTHTTLSCGK
jgi:hypothetical protein